MDLVELMRSRVDMILDKVGSGMKVMLMDSETTSSLSLSTPQSEIMKREVFLFEYLHARNSHPAANKISLGFLKCVVLIRPTKDNIRMLSLELNKPRFGSYYVYLTNRIRKSDLKVLAESDIHEVVQDVKEIPSDFLVLENHAFSLGLNQHPVLASVATWDSDAFQKSLDSLKSLMWAIKVGHGSQVAYLRSSNVCEELATGLYQQINSQDYSVVSSSPASIIILDRRMDPVTPLLNQWTYQAMVHELIGIRNNTVDMSSRDDGGNDDLKQLVTLSSANDEFYRHNMYANFGEIGQTIQNLVVKFQEKVKGHQKIDSIGDIKDFVSNYPEFKKMSGTVNKHVSLLGELSKDVKNYNLMEASECEQTICCGSDKENSLTKIQDVLSLPNIRTKDALRIVALYTIRYGHIVEKNLDLFCKSVKGMPRKDVYEFIQTVSKYGRNIRSPYLFDKETKLSGNPFHMLSSLRGTENVYTQHQPLVTKEILPDIVRGKQRSDLRYLTTSGGGGRELDNQRGKTILFFVGGFTYEECRAVHVANKQIKGCNAVIGGTTLLNYDLYMDEIRSAYKNR